VISARRKKYFVVHVVIALVTVPILVKEMIGFIRRFVKNFQNLGIY
jgi:hypothetical protein